MTQKDWYSKNLMVKSLGDHFGVGGYASFRKSDYSNHDLQVVIGPAIEYNVFRYQDATSGQFTFSYLINYEHAEYEQLTIYNKKREDLFRHDLSVNFFTMQNWGGISLSANASGYINKPSQYSVGANADARISLSDLFRGLSFNISGGFAYCNDQRSLSQQAFSAEDLLTGAREMEDDFSYGISIGLSYSFGSRKSNAVNPRFGY